jgi:CheY-like chemotaxis protein
MNGVKVVVIEDNRLNMELVADLLETAGHRVIWRQRRRKAWRWPSRKRRT